ncbi:MAG: galactokinase [Caulobacterales bacterium]|nr:galactokinase [Caulobacterales bacterium]
MTEAALFHTVFARAPEAESFTPGRVNLIGEHLDYNGGLVLPLSLAIGVDVAIAANGGGTHRIHSSEFGETAERPVGDRPRDHWSDYCVAALAKAHDQGLLDGGMDVTLASAIPPGSGLSSSAALIVGVLSAAGARAGAPRDPVATALAAQAVENDALGVPVGIMDQMAVAVAAPGEALALDTKTLAYEIASVPGDWRFTVIHSGVRRALNDGRYADRRRECEAAAAALGASDLCLLNPDQRARIDTLAPPLAGRARHAASEHERTRRAVDAMRGGEARAFGALMNASHVSMRDDFEITTPVIDRIVARAVEAGALGARMTGGGFGGCIVALSRGDADWFDALAESEPGVERLA